VTMARLGVNIDHVATLRQARGTTYPDPIAAAAYVEEAGADQITIHLREDRRHIQDHDVRMLRRVVTTRLNLEMAVSEEIVDLAIQVRPDCVTLVPERRAELTTEGGLDCTKPSRAFTGAMTRLQRAQIPVALFIDPDAAQIAAAQHLGVHAVELHTGEYCLASSPADRERALARIRESTMIATQRGLAVHAGHGLHLENIAQVVVANPEIEEYNIGHSIVARAVFVGLSAAVQEMRQRITAAQTKESL
jgi:pyridoxine 5-phosphate synthase